MNTAWKIILVWFLISTAILVFTRDYGNVIFSLSYGIGYGGLIYLQRARIRGFFSSVKTGRYAVFIFLAIIVSVSEEVYVYSLGNKIAIPNLMLDIIIVPGEWTVWFTTWYFLISRRYHFTEGEALMAAGIGGILFEYGGGLAIIDNPLGFVVSLPVTVVVYAAIFILPMQLIKFEGKRYSYSKYPVAVLLPYLLTIPMTILLYALFL